MTIFNYKDYINTTLTSFDPEADILEFDGSISGSDVTLDEQEAGLNISVNGESSLFIEGLSIAQLVSSDDEESEDVNIRFRDGSRIYVGDNNIETNDDDDANDIDFTASKGLLRALDGNDDVTVSGSDNIIRLEAGDDSVTVNGDDNIIYTGTGDDYIEISSTTSGNKVYTKFGDDTVIGSDNDDIIEANQGNDSVSGNAGDDNIGLGIGNDTGSGGSGDDTIYGRSGDDIINGDSGSDLIYGDQGNDTIISGSIEGGDDDTLVGGEGNDTFRIGIDTDDFTNASGSIVIEDFEAGDVIEFITSGIKYEDLDVEYTSSGLKITSEDLTASDEFNILLEGYFGELDETQIIIEADDDGSILTNFNNSYSNGIFANSSTNRIISGDSDDYIDAGQGSDIISAGGGDDVIIYDSEDTSSNTGSNGLGVDGGEGKDTLKFTNSTRGNIEITDAQTDVSSETNIYESIETFLVGVDNKSDVSITISGSYGDGMSGDELVIDGSRMTGSEDLSVTIKKGFDKDLVISGGESDDEILVSSSENIDVSIVASKGDDTVEIKRVIKGDDTIKGGEGEDDFTFYQDGDFTLDADDLANFAGFETVKNGSGSQGNAKIILNSVNVASQTLLFDFSDATSLEFDASNITTGVIGFTGTGANDSFIAGSGDTSIESGSGSDEFLFKNASDLDSGDTIDGGSGSSYIVLDFGNSTVSEDALSNISNISSIDINESGNTIEISREIVENFTGSADGTIQFYNGKNSITIDTTNIGVENGEDDADIILIEGDGKVTLKNSGGGSAVSLSSDSDANIEGSKYNDHILGSDKSNEIDGNAGDDYIFGGDADDTINAGSGADTVEGGAGRDIIDLGSDSDSDIITFSIDQAGDGAGMGGANFRSNKHDVITNFDSEDDEISFGGNLSSGNGIASFDTDGLDDSAGAVIYTLSSTVSDLEDFSEVQTAIGTITASASASFIIKIESESGDTAIYQFDQSQSSTDYSSGASLNTADIGLIAVFEDGTISTANIDAGELLTAGADNLVGDGGANLYVASNVAHYNSNDSIDGGSGKDTLRISGSGTIDFNDVASINSIELFDIESSQTVTSTLLNNAEYEFSGSDNSDDVTLGADAGSDYNVTINLNDGSDVLNIEDLSYISLGDEVDGGDGSDEVRFNLADQNIDLSNYSSVFTNIEKFKFTDDVQRIVTVNSAFKTNNSNANYDFSDLTTQTVTFNASDLDIDFTGGAANDTVTSAGGDINLGAGDDELNIDSDDITNDVLDGDSGSNTINIEEGSTSTAITDSVFARVFNFDVANINDTSAHDFKVTDSNYDLNNELTINFDQSNGNGVTVDSSELSGSKTLTINATDNFDTITLGDGTLNIDLKAGNDIVNIDSQFLDSDDTINGGAQSGATGDTLNITGSTALNDTISSVSGFKNININADAAHNITLGANNFTDIGVRLIVTALSTSTTGVTIDGSAATENINFNGTNGNDEFIVGNQTEDQVTMRGGNDTVNIRADYITSADLLSGGSGSDFLKITDDGGSGVIGGTLSTADLYNVVGFDTIRIEDVSAHNIVLRDNNFSDLSSDLQLTLVSGVAGSTINGSGLTNQAGLPTELTVDAENDNNKIYGGAGDDTIYAYGSADTIYSSDGNDQIDLDESVGNLIVLSNVDNDTDYFTGFSSGYTDGSDLIAFDFALSGYGTGGSDPSVRVVVNSNTTFMDDQNIFAFQTTDTDLTSSAQTVEDYLFTNDYFNKTWSTDDKMIFILSDGTDSYMWHWDGTIDSVENVPDAGGLTLLGEFSDDVPTGSVPDWFNQQNFTTLD